MRSTRSATNTNLYCGERDDRDGVAPCMKEREDAMMHGSIDHSSLEKMKIRSKSINAYRSLERVELEKNEEVGK